MPRPCCGQAPRRWRKAPARVALPPNPKINGGVKMIYVGAGQKTLKGRVSRLKYYLSDHRRHFRADPRDVDEILKSRHFMLEP